MPKPKLGQSPTQETEIASLPQGELKPEAGWDTQDAHPWLRTRACLVNLTPWGNGRRLSERHTSCGPAKERGYSCSARAAWAAFEQPGTSDSPVTPGADRLVSKKWPRKLDGHQVFCWLLGKRAEDICWEKKVDGQQKTDPNVWQKSSGLVGKMCWIFKNRLVLTAVKPQTLEAAASLMFTRITAWSPTLIWSMCNVMKKNKWQEEKDGTNNWKWILTFFVLSTSLGSDMRRESSLERCFMSAHKQKKEYSTNYRNIIQK